MKTVIALRHGKYGRKDSASGEIVTVEFEPNDELEIEDADVEHMVRQGAVSLPEEKKKKSGKASASSRNRTTNPASRPSLPASWASRE